MRCDFAASDADVEYTHAGFIVQATDRFIEHREYPDAARGAHPISASNIVVILLNGVCSHEAEVRRRIQTPAVSPAHQYSTSFFAVISCTSEIPSIRSSDVMHSLISFSEINFTLKLKKSFLPCCIDLIFRMLFD